MRFMRFAIWSKDLRGRVLYEYVWTHEIVAEIFIELYILLTSPLYRVKR